MLKTLSESATRAADIVTSYFREPLGTLESMAAPLATALGDASSLTVHHVDGVVEPFAADLRDLRPLPVYGAGFIVAIDLLRDARGHLAWWQGSEWRKLVLAAQNVNKERIDYSELEWYRVPVVTGASHVAGPYVDYLCSDEYTITLATPVHINGTFVGVVAFDLLIEEVERQLVPQLDDLGVDITLVNGIGRVVISTDPLRATGDTIRVGDAAGYERVPCEGIALDVLVSPHAQA